MNFTILDFLRKQVYYEMTRVGSTYELAGPRHVRKIYTAGEVFYAVGVSALLRNFVGGAMSIFLILSDDAIMKELVPYQLNIKTGTFY